MSVLCRIYSAISTDVHTPARIHQRTYTSAHTPAHIHQRTYTGAHAGMRIKYADFLTSAEEVEVAGFTIMDLLFTCVPLLMIQKADFLREDFAADVALVVCLTLILVSVFVTHPGPELGKLHPTNIATKI